MSRRFSILLVDNDPEDLERALLGHLTGTHPDWDIRAVRTAEEARRILDSQPPDAVVLDLALSPGGREGLGLLEHIRRHLPATAAVLLVGSGDARFLRDAFLTETTGEDLAAHELAPEGVLFREELLSEDSFDELEGMIEAGLHKYGRVRNEKAVLVTHGTDTMAWGFAYLRYALKGLTANVAVTGSQTPLGGYYSGSDALGNLRTAVFLLNRLRPARLFAVFNDGRSVFSGRLTKYRKWDSDAFEGRVVASSGEGGLRTLRKNWVQIPYPEQKLKDLHLIRTGGTIESRRRSDGKGALAPGGDFVLGFLEEALGDCFQEVQCHDLFALDSSNMSFTHWAEIAKAIEGLGVGLADTRFDPTVKPVYCNPLFTTQDYRAQFAACGRGAILAGFGGGNANVLPGSIFSVLPALRASVKAGTFVAVTSQVPLEPYDAEYETGLALLEAGGLPCGDLPLTDAQVKLSFLLGHWDIIEAKAAATGQDPRCLLAASFLAGVTMRRSGSLSAFRDAGGRIIPLRVLPDDPFVVRPFEEAIEAVSATLSC